MANYVVGGYNTPAGVKSKDAVKEMQKQLNAQGAGLVVDGIWGAKTEAAYKSKQTPVTSSTYTAPSQAGRMSESYPKNNQTASPGTNGSNYFAGFKPLSLFEMVSEKVKESAAKKKEAGYQDIDTKANAKDASIFSKWNQNGITKMIQDSMASSGTQKKVVPDVKTVLKSTPTALKYTKPASQAVLEQMQKPKSPYTFEGMMQNSLESSPRFSQQAIEDNIKNTRGATTYSVSKNASSKEKLYDIIDNTYSLGETMQSRAKFTIDGLSAEQQSKLLLDVMLDGPHAYFSREANEQGAYNLFFGTNDTRLHKGIVLPGEGQARQVINETLNRNNAQSPTQARVTQGVNPPSWVMDGGSLERVKNFQRQYGLKADGIWGTQTQAVYDALKERTANTLRAEFAKVADAAAPRTASTQSMSVPLSVVNGRTQQQAANVSQKDIVSQKISELNRKLADVQQSMASIPAWEKIRALGAGGSERYDNLRKQEAQLKTEVKKAESVLRELETRRDDVLEYVPTARPSPSETPFVAGTPKGTEDMIVESSPSPKSSSTPSPTPTPDPYMSFTEQQLKDIGWVNVTEETVNGLNNAIRELELDTPFKVLCFLATISRETGNNKDLVEGKSGSTKYRGGGYIHLSGQGRYERFAEYMGDPEILNQGAQYVAENYPWESAIWFWKEERKVNRVFDADDGGTFQAVTEKVREIGRPVSEDRQKIYDDIKSTLFPDIDD